MRRLAVCAFLTLLGVLAGSPGTASAGPSALSFSVTVPFTATSSCPGPTCVGHGVLLPYGSASAVLDGSGFDLGTWVLTLTTASGTLVLDLVADDIACTTPGRSGDIPRPPTSGDFGNPVTCTVVWHVAGGTGQLAGATGELTGTFGFAGTVGTFTGTGDLAGG
ncbi:MAG: hypothetical protein ACXVGH_08950 [Mycobacteriales bacterium]